MGWNWGSAAGGAGSGAAAGSAFGPIGAGVGAGVGFLTGGLSGGDAPPDYADMYRQQYGNMQGFTLPGQYQTEHGRDVMPYFQDYSGGVNAAYGASINNMLPYISQFDPRGTGAWNSLSKGSALNREGYQDYLDWTRQGHGVLSDELARIEAIQKGGWDLSNPAAYAEIAPEVGAISDSLQMTQDELAAYGVRGGVGETAKANALREAAVSRGRALQDAIQQSRQTQLGIGQQFLGFKPAEYRDQAATAQLSALGQFGGQAMGTMGQLWGDRARAFTDAYRRYFETSTNMSQANIDRTLQAFQLINSGALGADQVAQGLNQQERDALNQMMQDVGEAAGQIDWGQGGGGTWQPGMPPMTLPGATPYPNTGPPSITPSAPSDTRVKSDPGRVTGALSQIRDLPVYDYRYNKRAEEVGVPEGTPGRGVMAQDLEKNPRTAHLVKHDPVTGMRSVDIYGLAATALQAAKELDTKLERMRRAKWKVSGMKKGGR